MLNADSRMIEWSIVVAVLGLLGTWVWMSRLGRSQSSPDPILYWVLGLAALLPAWLTGFLGLIGPLNEGVPEPSLVVPFVLSPSAGLLGVILTDGVVSRLHQSGRAHGPATYWILGVAALVPAWGIAILGATRIQP